MKFIARLCASVSSKLQRWAEKELGPICEPEAEAVDHEVLEDQRSRLQRRFTKSNWDAFAQQYERTHGPAKPLNPVEQAGLEALQEAHANIRK